MAQGKSGLIANAASLGSAAYTGDYVIMQSRNGRMSFHVHVENSGATYVGTLKCQGSNDPDAAQSEMAWVDVETEAIASATDNDTIFDVSGSGVKAYRIVTAYTSGTGGTITVICHQPIG